MDMGHRCYSQEEICAREVIHEASGYINRLIEMIMIKGSSRFHPPQGCI